MDKFKKFCKNFSISFLKCVAIFILLVFGCLFLAINIKAVDITYGNGGIFDDCVDSLVDALSNDDNYSSGTKSIVANAQFEAIGETYVDIPFSDYNLVHSESFMFGAYLNNAHYCEISSFIPNNQKLYFLTISYTNDDYSIVLCSYFYPINSYDSTYLRPSNITCDTLGASSFIALEGAGLDSNCYPYNIVYDSLNESFWLILYDFPGTFPTVNATLNIYEVSNSGNTLPSTIDNIGSIIASGMTFGLDGITSSVSTAFDSVFLDNDGNLSNYSIFVFWALGVSVALGFFKYILDWVLSLGSRK